MTEPHPIMDENFLHTNIVPISFPETVCLNNQNHIMDGQNHIMDGHGVPFPFMLQGEAINSSQGLLNLQNFPRAVDTEAIHNVLPAARNRITEFSVSAAYPISNAYAEDQYMEGIPISAVSLANLFAARNAMHENPENLAVLAPLSHPGEGQKIDGLDYPNVLNHSFGSYRNYEFDVVPEIAGTVVGRSGSQPFQLTENVNSNTWFSSETASLSSDSPSGSSRFSNELCLSLTTSQSDVACGATIRDQCSDISCSGVTNHAFPQRCFDSELTSCNSRNLSLFNHTGSLLLQTMLYLANSEFSSLDLENGSVLPPQTDMTAKCYGEYGCYSINYPWSDILRPVAQFPEAPEKVSPKYCLFTRRNADSCELLDHKDPTTMYRSYLVPTHKIYFVAHGFLESGDRPWIKKLTKALLHKGDVNVIVIDWGSGSMPPYAQAVANIRLVGRITAHLIQTMRKELGVRVEYCHVIGHSLGAHLSGYVGHTMQEQFGVKLGRISGLDPAEPHFSQTAPEVRLDPTDAYYVDIIHTDATPFIKGGLGMDEPVGHLDFYPNGGESQPGCDQSMANLINEEKGSFFKGLRRFLNCDHVRSYEYFIESVNADPQCAFMAVECESWENYLAGNCFGCDQKDRMCATFGMNSVHSIQKISSYKHSIVPSPLRKEVKLFLVTNNKEPFCQTQFKVTVIISNSTQSVEHGGEIGLFEVEIMGTLGKTRSIPLFREQYYKPGGTYTGVVADMNVGHMKGGILHWQHRTTLNILTWRFDSVVIYINRVIVESLVPSEKIELCPEGSSVLVSGRSTNLHPCPSLSEPEVKIS